MPAANAETMSLHLTAIGRKVAAGSHAALVLDGAGYHIAAALTIPENVTLVRLPPYAPELNPMENVWEYLRGNKLAITVFDDYDDIVDWGKAHLAFLRGFAEFHFGIPCADWLRCIMNRTDPELFMDCFSSWVAAC